MALYRKQINSQHCERRPWDRSWLEEFVLLFLAYINSYPTTLPPPGNSVPDREVLRVNVNDFTAALGQPLTYSNSHCFGRVQWHKGTLIEKRILSGLFCAPIPALEGAFTYFRLDMSSVPWQTQADVSLFALHLAENRAGTSLTGCQKKVSREHTFKHCRIWPDYYQWK